MRRIILLVLVAALAFFGYICITDGVSNDSFNIDISEFKQVEKDSEKMTKELAAYNKKNDEQFEVVKNDLNVAIKSYEDAKSEYEDLINVLGIQDAVEENIIETTKKAYQIDFLLATIGNYATKEGIQDLDLVFVESVTAKAPVDAGYILADLKFTVSGDYILIANFLYDLEDDDRLAYEIKDYNMVKDKATFTVYNVPVESSTLSTITSGNIIDTTMGDTNMQPSNNISDGIDANNTVQGASVKTTNTTNTTNTVTNSVN